MNDTEIVDLWAQGDTATNFFHKKVLLVLGHRDVAKGNFIQFLAQNGSSYQVKDSTSFKPTLAPVTVHTFSDVTIYDFDSFDESTETGGLPLGISSTYLLQKVINSTDEVQIILLINYLSSKHGIDKHHFTAQIRKISFWLKNIDNYANSIGLVVTNVANTAENQVLVELDEILNHVETFLEQLRKENTQNLSILKLLNILLRKTKGADYERIGIFRQPNGLTSQKPIELFKNEWQKMKVFLNEIQFSPTSINDFDYIQHVDYSTKHVIKNLIEEIDKRIAKKIDEVFQQLQNEFEKDLHNNHAEAGMKLQKMKSIKNITQTINSNAREALFELDTKMNQLNIILTQSCFDDTLRLVDFMQFLFPIDSDLIYIFQWRLALAKIYTYIRNFQRWNTFLEEMEKTTSSYAVRKDSEKLYKIFVLQPITDLEDARLQQFMKDYWLQTRSLSGSYELIKKEKFSSLKMLSLENVFRLNLVPNAVHFEINNSTGVSNVFGDYIFLSDIISKFPNQKFLSINAGLKIFIDTNISRSDDNNLQMLSIISPVWELKHDAQIILDGRKGYTSIILSRDGNSGENGEHGRPGHPGNSAGHFLGVADSFINNLYNLLISANGGNGGNGTNGGAGGNGKVGDTAVTDNCERKGNFDSFQREELSGVLFHDYCVYGRQGDNGGRGGNGGVGAEGGFSGDMTLISFQKVDKVRTSTVDGQRGKNGKGGVGGEAGKNGKSWKITKRAFWWGPPQCNKESNDYCGAKSPVQKALNGDSGTDAYVRDTLRNPEKIEHPHWSSLLSTYRKYLWHNLQEGNLKGKTLSFLEELNKNSPLMDLDMPTTLADEFFYLDTQYRTEKDSLWLPHFEQLLYRTEHYLTTTHSPDDIEIAKMVQAAILAKLVYIKNLPERNLIVNLTSYLEIPSARIKKYDPKSRYSYLSYEVESRQSEFTYYFPLGDSRGGNVIDNNAAEITELIKETQADVSLFSNESYEQIEHKMAILRTLMTMKQTFHFLSFIEGKGKSILDVTLPVNKYFFPEAAISTTTTAEIKGSVLQLTKTRLNSWKKQFEPVLKGLVDNSTAFSSLNGQLKQCYNFLLETKTENFYGTSKNIRELIHKMISSTADLKAEEQNFIEKLQQIWFLCDFEFENCNLVENYKKLVRALNLIKEGFVFSKVQQFSDNIMEIYESFLSGILENPQKMVLDVLFNSKFFNLLFQIQILFQKIKQSFKSPLPELVEHSFVALEAGTMRLEYLYKYVAYYQEMKRLKAALLKTSQNNLPIITDLGNSIDLSILQYTYQNYALTPFYQLDFPFAYDDAEDLEIIVDNYHQFKREAPSAIDYIRSKIRRGPIPSRARQVTLMYHTLHELYRWKGEKHEKTIENLLQGKPVTVKADVLDLSQYIDYKQSVKARNINLQLQTKNKTLQKELDKDLAAFGVTLIHSGMSYYKCRDNIFTFTHAPLSIYHSFFEGGSQNMVHSKLKESDYILSPFTVWRIGIAHVRKENTNKIFNVLQKYKHSIDIVLKAEFIYLNSRSNPIPNSPSDYCNINVLSKFYKNEDIIIRMNSTSDFSHEIRIPNTEASLRRKRHIKQNKGMQIAKESPMPENRALNYSRNVELSNHQIGLYEDKIPLLDMSKADRYDGINACSGFQYSLNDCLILFNLIVQRLTDSKPTSSYFRDCAVNYSKVRQCALEIVRRFEETLQVISENHEVEAYSFDPVLLMEELEQNIINNGGKNISGILLNAVSPREKPEKKTFFQHLWNKLMKP